MWAIFATLSPALELLQDANRLFAQQISLECVYTRQGQTSHDLRPGKAFLRGPYRYAGSEY
jgi:hypothetical protein